ncbi:SDR family oxidoreductase [Streptomyces sp. HD]|uniref:SDR family oxidoreductase n=1 Tax=Streptomyces sp. HD TaxID=3020892 RepID=UPI00232F602B|nr:SDR family oxidoreductase [Streptomyces sp. HD]MDC0772595.1 SDR family oxidoreductase [Streptomyces sp. HD]
MTSAPPAEQERTGPGAPEASAAPGAPAGLGLAGKVAVVTGASRGVGRAVARRLCASGVQVLLDYAHSDEDARSAARSMAGLPGSVLPVRADVTRKEDLERLLSMAGERYGRLDIFVHAAADWHPMPAVGADPGGVKADVAAAVDPLLNGVPALAELMAPGPGRVVVISSIGARATVPRYVGLGVAKAALESLVRYLAVELADRAITVNAVSTSKIDKGGATASSPAARALAARTPAGRLTVPEDIADVVALLCTTEAGWIQGQVITADGGLSLLA